MKKLFLFLLLVFTVSISKAQPIAIFNRTQADLGTILWKNPTTTSFTVTNRGNQPLLIQHVETDCGCTAAEWPTEPIAAGESTTITATYDAAMLGRFHKSISVYTNIDDLPIYLDITGSVSNQLTDYSKIYPYQIGNICLAKNFIDFGDIHKGGIPTKVINIINIGDTDFAPTLMHLPPYITVQSIPETLTRKQTGKLLFTIDSDKIPNWGQIQTSIYLSRFMGDKVSDENRINLSAILLPDFSHLTSAQLATAPSIQMSSEKISMTLPVNRKKQSQTVNISNKGLSELTIEAVQVSSSVLNVSLNKNKLAAGEKTKFKITAVRNTVKEWPTTAYVWLITNDPKNPKMTLEVKINK